MWYLNRISIAIFILICILTGCSYENDTVLFKKLTKNKTGVDFTNRIIESDSVNVVSFTNVYNGGGVGAADFNKDGLPDLFFTGNMVSSQLYLNQTSSRDIKFKNISKEANIHTDRWATGVTIADVNDDGWPDVYVCVSGSDLPEKRQNYLFIHQGLNSSGIPYFDELSKDYGLDDKTYSTQAAFLDYDLDNDLDLYIAVNFADQFYGATVNIPTPNKKGYSDRSDRLYQNIGVGSNGHPVFKDVSVEAGILHEGYTLGLVVQDIDQDGWPDIYEANDFLSNDILYMNQGNGTFVNKIGEYFKHTTFAGMGMDISDYNNDGWQDIFVLDMTPADNLRHKSMMLPVKTERFTMNLKSGYYPQYNRNTLQLNNGFKPDGAMSFSEIGQLANVHHTDWSWTALFCDLNNNGLRDLLVCNGFRRDLQDIDNIHYLFGDNPFGTREHWERQFVGKVKDIKGIYVTNYMLENNGDLTFTDRSQEWGFNVPSYSNGGIVVDLDNDGDLDIVINNLDENSFIYENRILNDKQRDNPDFNYLKIQLSTSVLNASNIGAKIDLKHGVNSQTHQHYVTRGYLSSLEPTVHFGLGKDTIVQEVKVQWPDGFCQVIENIAANQLLIIDKEEKVCTNDRQIDQKTDLFENITTKKNMPYRHKEFDYDDFIFQPLLLQKHSMNGPGMAAGDLNGDGLEDLVAGGARGQSTSILVQDRNGNFRNIPLKGSEPFEDLGLLLFDADGDLDLDLYAVSGSSEYGMKNAYYQDRLYLNDGKGNYIFDSLAIPASQVSGSCVLSTDFDLDGDLDLFVGGRIKPRAYPMAPDSYFLLNESTDKEVKFVDVTETWGSEIRDFGMVSSGLFTDFNNDGRIDLVLVGEWTPVRFFENTGKAFRPLAGENGLEYSNGWWNSIDGADFDKDGDIDYVLGNLGLNTMLKAGKDEPLRMYVNDFDQNGQIDPLLFYYEDGINVPFHPKSLLTAQLKYLERQFPTYSDFANANLDNVLDEEQKNLAEKLYVYEFRSSYIENLGNNTYKISPLPMIAQSAPVYGTLIDDFDGDGNFDVLLVGNSKASNLILGWFDASIGYLLKGKGDGTFSVEDGTKTGFYADSNAKSIVQIENAFEEPLIIVANNNDSLNVFRRKSNPERIIRLNGAAAYASVFYNDGSQQKMEFYKGSGYLSSHGNSIFLNSYVNKIQIFDLAKALLQEFTFD